MSEQERTAIVRSVTHYADERPGYPPICEGGQRGDLMSFFPSDVTCPDCLATFGPANGSTAGGSDV